ncbi:MAG: GNAT family N-acetyltransferase [Candidatus Bathyarchaeia archaeon]
MKPVEIRTLTIEDYDAIIELWKRAGLPFKPKGRDSKEMMEKQIETFPEFFVGAFCKSKLVGIVIGSLDGRMKGWVNRLAVDPECRHRGVAQQLVSTIEKILESHGASIFCALIESSNEESIRLFRKFGYINHQEIFYFSKRRSEDV